MSKLHIENIYGKLFIEVDGNYTTEHKVPYVILPATGDSVDIFYVEATDFFNEMLGIKVKEVINNNTSLAIYVQQELKLKELEKLPKDTIISSVEILDENENPMVVTRIQISIKE